MNHPKADPVDALAPQATIRGHPAGRPSPTALDCFRSRRVAGPGPRTLGAALERPRDPASVPHADAFAAVLRSFAECRVPVPVPIEVLPFLCSFADLLRHTLGDGVDVTVSVDRACPAWTVDRAALEQALLQVMLGSGCAVRGKGRLSFQASLDARSSSQSTLLTVFNHSSLEDFSSFEWRG